MILVLVLSCVLLILLVPAFRVFAKESEEIKRNVVWLILLCSALVVLAVLFKSLGG